MVPGSRNRLYDPLAEANRTVMVATRNAPPWVLCGINRARRKAGTGELRAGQFARIHKADEVRAQGLGIIAGLAAYGVSSPTTCDYDTRPLPESFAPKAFADSVEAINRGLESAWLSIGHTEDEVANTADGSLNLRVHHRYGLEFWANLDTSDEHKQIARLARSNRLAVSVGFLPVSQETHTINGQRHRLITKAVLKHVAILDTSRAAPAYRSARVFHSWGADVRAITATLARARLAGFHSAIELKLARAGR